MAKAEAEPWQPVTAQTVGNAFVEQYYAILHQSPELVHKFYQDISKLGRPKEDGSMSITTTMQGIDEKIVSLNYGDFRTEIKSVDSQESLNDAVHVLVTGYQTGKDNKVSHFLQCFVLAPQEHGYFVLNDTFRYVNDDVVPIAAEPVQENHLEEAVFENGHVPIPAEEEAVPEKGHVLIPGEEVVDRVLENGEPAVETSAKIEEAQKKSYASIVKHLMESAVISSPPPVAPLEQVKTTISITSSDSFDNKLNQEGEGTSYSIYLKGLPMNATEALLEKLFSKFGTIKKDGIQVRSNRQQGFCYGFVEFEEAFSVQKALEASPIANGGSQVFVEEKKSTNSGGNNRGATRSYRGRSSRGRGGYGSGGRGGYGGGSGYYNRGDFKGWGGNRGGKDITPRVPAKDS